MAFIARHRYPLIVGLVLLGIAVSGIAARLHNDRPSGRPLMITPAFLPASSSPSSAAPAPSLTLSKMPVATRRPPSRSPSRSPSPSSSPSRSSPPPSAAADFAARLFVSAGRRGSVRGAVVVANQGAAARGWRLVMVLPGVRVTEVSGASFVRSGSTVTLTGTSVAPDESVTVRLGGTYADRDALGRPTCRIEGRACEITTRGIPE